MAVGVKKSNAEVACRRNGKGGRFRLLFKEAFAEPKKLNNDVRIRAV